MKDDIAVYKLKSIYPPRLAISFIVFIILFVRLASFNDIPIIDHFLYEILDNNFRTTLEPIIYIGLMLVMLHISFLPAQMSYELEFHKKHLVIKTKKIEKVVYYNQIKEFDALHLIVGYRIKTYDNFRITFFIIISLNIFNYIKYIRIINQFDKIKRRRMLYS